MHFRQLGLQRAGRGFGGFGRVEVQFDAVGDRAQRVAVDHARQAADHRLGELVLARQFGQRVAGDLAAIGAQQAGLLHRQAQHVRVQLVVVLDIALVLAVLDLVQRRLRNIDIAALDDVGHLPVEERQKQRADVRAVDVRIGHDDDAVVTQLLEVVVVLADAGAQRGDQRQHFLARQHLVEARALDVQDLAFQRQDRLELAVAALLGGAACGVALDQEQFGQRRIAFLAVGELAGQAHAVERALAARHFTGLARGFTRAGGVDDLAADDLGVVRRFQQEVAQRLRYQFLDRQPHFRRHQLVLGLRAEFRLGHLDRQHAGQALAHVVAGGLDLGLLGDLVFFDVLVDDARHRRAQAGQVGTAIALRNIVGEAEHLLVEAVIPLHRHFDGNAFLLRIGVEDIRMQHRLGAIDVFDETLDAAGEGEILFLAGALIGQANMHAVIEERQFADALGQDLVMEFDVREDFLVGEEVDFGTALVGRTEHLHRRDFDRLSVRAVDRFEDAVLHRALGELDEMRLAVAAHRQAQPFGQRVDAGHTDAVQAARDLVAVLVELAAGVQLGHRDFRGAAPGLVLVVELDAVRNATAVVDDRDRVVGMDRDLDFRAVAGQRLVDGVVQHLEHEVMQAGAIRGVADIHARPLAYRLQAFQDLDRGGAVAVFLLRVLLLGHVFLLTANAGSAARRVTTRPSALRMAVT